MLVLAMDIDSLFYFGVSNLPHLFNTPDLVELHNMLDLGGALNASSPQVT